MAKQVVDVGSKANDGSGDSLREAGLKINSNFTEVYSALGGSSGNLSVVSKLTGANGMIVSNPTGDITLTNRIATTTQLGVIKVGTNLSINSEGVLSANAGAYTLPTATSSVLGGIKVGSRLSISNGILSADVQNNTGSLLFTNTIMYNNTGVTISNQGPSTGGTAFLTLPTDAGPNVNLQNNYGTVTVVSGSSPASTNIWSFDTDGGLTFPSGDIRIGPDPDGIEALIGNIDTPVSIIAQGTGGVIQSLWVDSVTEPGNVAGILINSLYANTANSVQITTGTVTEASGGIGQVGIHNWSFGTDGKLTLPAGGDILNSNGDSVLGGGGGGISISDFGEGFVDNLDNGKITTSKLYNENPNQGLNNQYTLEVTNGGVVALPDGSIINGATLKSVPGNYAGITAGPVGQDEDSWVWVDGDGAWIATDYSGNANTWKFKNDGNLELPKNTTITLPASTDEDRYGGDINITGQRGYGDWSTEGYAGFGSSIYIRSGDGGENNVSDQGGEGGEVWIRSGDGQAGNNGGTASLIAGSAKYNNSGSAIYGGNVHVTAGNAQESASGLGHGGNVNINAGEGDQANGSVNINTTGGDFTWTFDPEGVLTIPSSGDIKRSGVSVLGGGANTGNFTFNADTIANNNDASIVVGGSLGNVGVQTVDELVPPGGVWRLFIDDGVYPTVGDIVQVGDTVTTSWGTPITATITEINQLDGEWRIHVDQDITAEFNDYDTVTFSSSSSKTWTFDTGGALTLPAGGDILDSNGDSVLGGGATSYAPDDTDNWNDPTINTISAALDELAARITALQNFEIDGGNANTPALGELLIDGNGA